MVKIHFTSNLRRHVDCPSVESNGANVRDVLAHVFAANTRLKTYVLDDQGHLRKHMRILVDGLAIKDLEKQSDIVQPSSEVWVMQALSGG
jgi:molybdopterin synthase sulfur carrier subunit